MIQKRKGIENMHEKCTQLLGNVFNATNVVYILLEHRCQPPGGVRECIREILGIVTSAQRF